MKKIVLVLMVLTVMFYSTLGISADGVVGNTYQIENVTVVFDASSQLSIEQQEKIACLIVNPEYGVSQANLICNIFGHKNTQEGVSTVTHCVSATSPRCLQEHFVITICSRCDESTVQRTSYYYITCCPED
ncbi:MAG: hypothetical protein E7659_07305 [Ruminococcaceae bacterium]|nr:hypothetical protein [Oscillospiraceae bacterium]